MSVTLLYYKLTCNDYAAAALALALQVLGADEWGAGRQQQLLAFEGLGFEPYEQE